MFTKPNWGNPPARILPQAPGCINLEWRLFHQLLPVAAVFILNPLWSADAIAAPEEVQVYLDDFAEVGKSGLDLHTNYVPSGQQSTNYQFRVTPELGYGINTNWEVAAYWLIVKDTGRLPQTDGMKLRTRWRPKAPLTDSLFYWAVNFEVGIGHASVQSPDKTVLKAIIGVPF